MARPVPELLSRQEGGKTPGFRSQKGTDPKSIIGETVMAREGVKCSSKRQEAKQCLCAVQAQVTACSSRIPLLARQAAAALGLHNAPDDKNQTDGAVLEGTSVGQALLPL